jgi:hypothetical protein
MEQKKACLKAKIDELETNNTIKLIGYSYRGGTDF